VSVYYDGPENTQSTTIIRQATMQYNTSCIALVIGWWQSGAVIHPGTGNIQSQLEDIQMKDSDYGILTIAMDKTTGINQPSLKNIQFTNIAKYPIYLGGTSYPNFISGNSISNTPGFIPQPASSASESQALPLAGMELAGNAAALEAIQPGSQARRDSAQSGVALSALPNLAPAIGLAGYWNNSGTLPGIAGIPYAVTGKFPLTVIINNLNFTPPDDVTIGMSSPASGTATVTVPAGTIFKFDASRKLTVKGALSLLSTPSQPVIFTSIKDDAAGGDTNKDGSLTHPDKANWGEVQLAYGAPDFHHTVVRYATNGLHMYFDGAVNANLLATVRENVFTSNNFGISLTAKKMGDIIANINHNTFRTNGAHIYGNPSDTGNSGQLCVTADHNDLWGGSTQNGITNMNLNGVEQNEYCPVNVFDARNNFWGSPTGPTHPGNPGGTGSVVSDRVLYTPWLGSAVFPPVTYSIMGRVILDNLQGPGLAGVTVTLQGQINATQVTDADGYYQFEALEGGSYIVYPSLQGYLFNPPSVSVTIDSADASEINFVAILSPADVAISVAPYNVLRPISAGTTATCKFTVSLNKALPMGKTAKVDFYTADGTATQGSDYTARSGTLTFLANGATSQQVIVNLLTGVRTDPEEFLSLILTNPVNATLTNSAATCTILSRADSMTVYLPTIRK
jgi:hypothetical protein